MTDTSRGHFGRHLRPAITSVIGLTLLTGCIFPLVLFAFGRMLFPAQAAGSLITRDGMIVGARVIGQSFAKPEYFHPRPSAAGAGYDATASGGTNFGPANPKLIDDVRKLADAYRQENGLAPDADVPIDAVTRSGSGLDPHISPQNASIQAARVARARGVSENVVRDLLTTHVQEPQLGFIGNARVSILDLNLALDQAAPPAHR